MSIAPRTPRLIAAFALSLLAASGVPAHAQTGAAATESRHPLEIVPPQGAPLIARDSGLVARRSVLGGLPDGGGVMTLDFVAADAAGPGAGGSVADAIGRWYQSAAYWLASTYNSITDGLTPPTPETFTKGFKSKDPDDFWQLVGDAGYKLKEIATDVGVVPDVGFKFRYVRELSDGDVNWLERKLRRHEEKYRDPLSMAQRAIIYTLLSINSSDDYFVEELRVKLLPLPTARFSLVPWDSGLSWEHDTLMRAIQGQQRVLRKPMEEDSHY